MTDGAGTGGAGLSACVFDAYGTLLDVHAAAGRHRAAIGAAIGDGAAAGRLSDLWRRKQLEYTWLRSLMGAHADFEAVTADALDHAMAAAGLAGRDGLRRDLLAAYRVLSPYPEVPAVLRSLRQRGLRTAILSNGTPSMLNAAVRAAGVDGLLDAVLSVEDVGVFKPDPRVYQLAVDRLALPAGRICFVSSNGWDAHGAAHFGFHTVWVNRAGAAPERLPGKLAAVVDDLTALPGVLGL